VLIRISTENGCFSLIPQERPWAARARGFVFGPAGMFPVVRATVLRDGRLKMVKILMDGNKLLR
jgi:hypothetical protein